MWVWLMKIWIRRHFSILYQTRHLISNFSSGYGHSTPNTISGKVFTMFYAIVGIPLGLVMFQSIGERLNKFSSVVIRNVKKLMHCKDSQVRMNLKIVLLHWKLFILVSKKGKKAFCDVWPGCKINSTYRDFLEVL